VAWIEKPPEEAPLPTVRVVPGLGRASRSTAVFLYGEHDYAAKETVERALEALGGHIIVDLSWCTFIDSSIIALILVKHATLARNGDYLEVIVPPTQQHLTGTFDRLGMRDLLHVRDAPPA
jgi:anti-anti-sigma regulatory factor